MQVPRADAEPIPQHEPATTGAARRRLLRCAALLTLAAGGAGAQAQDARPLKIVVPFPPGGATDALARLAAEAMGPRLGQTVIVENRGGAGGAIAAEHVSRAPADGNTLLVAGQAVPFINKALYRKLPYDPEEFVFIGMLGSFPNVLVTHPTSVPARTMAEFVDHARANPGKLSYGSNGVGSLSHLTTEVLASTARLSFVHVPYQGAAPQMADLLSGRIGFSIIASQTVMPMIRDGRLRALAVSTGTRFRDLPEVPTLVESGFASLDAPVWFALVAPAATPAPMVARLRAALDAVVGAPAYAEELEKKSAIVMRVPADASGPLLAREKALWTDAVRMTGATAE